MSLLQMSFSGAVLILVIILIRTALINRLPKKVFLALWSVVVLRLILPFSIPSVFSIYSLLNRTIPDSTITNEQIEQAIPIISLSPSATVQNIQTLTPNTNSFVSVWFIIWCIGTAFCMLFFILTYLRCMLEFRTSLPVHNDFTSHWLENHPLKRTISIRQSDRILSPLTYGIFHPVILMPKQTDWEDTKQLQYIFLHEYMHITHYDSLIKPVVICALCIHWFNPLVWVMYILFNQDIELACDERVLNHLGEESKSAYAHTLINMEAKKSGLIPFYNHFSKNAIEKRIKAIMKTRKMTVGIILISILLPVTIIALFATSPQSKETTKQTNMQMLYVLDRLYISTNEDVSEMVAAEAEISEYDSPYIGTIASTVDPMETPDKELQSNFGSVGSQVVFNGDSVAVNIDGKWIQFDPEEAVSFTPSSISKLAESIAYSDGRVSFTIPDEEGTWNIQISGRIDVDGMDGMNVLYLTEENETNQWERGKTYSFDVSDGGYTELILDAAFDKSNLSMDIMTLLPTELKAVSPIIPEDLDVPDTVLNAAIAYINSDIQIYPDFERDYSNWRIESLTQVYTYEDFNRMTLSVYCLNYEFLAKDPKKINLVGGMAIDIEGWVIPNYANSIYLIFRQDGETLSYLTAMFENDCFPGEELFDHDLSLQLQEDTD